MPEAPQVPRYTLAPGYDISRLIKGGWQLAGGHGQVAIPKNGACAREHAQQRLFGREPAV
jgi:hypothetical protein